MSCVCVYVCPLIPAASHIGITKERYQRILRNTGIVLNFADFPKNASFKCYGVICLSRAAPASWRFFPPRNKLLCWFEAYSYVFTAQTTGLWKTACDSLAQTRETAQIPYSGYFTWGLNFVVFVVGKQNTKISDTKIKCTV